MIKAVIVEDEKNSREMLNDMISMHCPQVKVLALASSVQEGLKALEDLKPDLVFLDIEMADGSGFDILHKYSGNKIEVIFTTASDKYALKAIKFSALDYLLKPIDIDELKQAVDKISKKQSGEPSLDNLRFLLQNLKKNEEQFSRITLPTNNSFEIVNIKDIVRCESEGSYTNFILTDGKKLLVSSNLKHYEDLLPADIFVRIHHQHLVNINHVKRLLKNDGGYAVMSDGSSVEISRRKKEYFLQKLQMLDS